MMMLAVTLVFAGTIAAPYALVMAVPRLSQAVVAAIAVAVPTVLSMRIIGLDRFTPATLPTNTDALLVVATLLSLATAVFVRTSVAVLGQRAAQGAAFVTINVLGLALALSTLPWLADFLAHLPTRG